MELCPHSGQVFVSCMIISCFLFPIPTTSAAGARSLKDVHTSPPHTYYTPPHVYHHSPSPPPYSYPSRPYDNSFPSEVTETCSGAPEEFINKLLYARRQDCEPIAAECKKVAISRGISDTNCEDCKRKCLNPTHQITETCFAAPREFIEKLLNARRQDCEPIAAECKEVAISLGISDTNCEDCKRQCLDPDRQITETCSAAPREFIDKLLEARRQDCEPIAAECKKVAISRGISDTNCEDCKRQCLNPDRQITETCAEAPREFIHKLLNARRQDCEPIAAECKKVAISRGISDTNCEDCKRQCLNPDRQITETCAEAPREFIDKLLNARRQDCEPIAAECKKVAISRGISDTNCEDCKRQCLDPDRQITETCSEAPREFIDKLLNARRQDCEPIAAECKKVAISRGISDTNCEDCKRQCLNPDRQITETCAEAPREFIEKLLNARRQDCEPIAAECKQVAVSRGVSDTNCEDCKRQCLDPDRQITETCSEAPREFIDKLLYARRQDCEPIAAECKKVALSRRISDSNCEDCKRQCLNPPRQITETCSAAPKEFIDKLLYARRQDCESIAAECRKVAISQNISDTNCEDCKRKCLNRPH